LYSLYLWMASGEGGKKKSTSLLGYENSRIWI
jgi:hypothetical protein